MKNKKLLQLQIISSTLFLSTIATAYAEVKVGTIIQQSVNTSGLGANGSSFESTLSPDARYLAFTSNASNLVSGDTNGSVDVFVKDLKTGVVTIESTSSSGELSNATCYNPSLSFVSPEGKYAVAFSSTATNLTTLGNNDKIQTYLKTPDKNETILISRSPQGLLGDGDSKVPSVGIFADESKLRIAFESAATNLVSNDTNNFTDIFLAEIDLNNNSGGPQIPTIKRLSISTNQLEADSNSTNAKISGDGQYVVFSSLASNLIQGTSVPDSISQIYLVKVKTGEIKLISKGSDGLAGSYHSISPSISFSGRYIAYATNADNIINGSSQNQSIALYDTKTGITTQVDLNDKGAHGAGPSESPAISPDGKYVSFSNNGRGFANDNINQFKNIFVKDTVTGQLVTVTRNLSDVIGNSHSTVPSISFSGLYSTKGGIAFTSSATNLTSTGIGQASSNIFTRDIEIPKPPITNGSTIEVPPSVTVKKSDVTIQLPSFDTSSLLRASKKTTLVYNIEITPKSKKNGSKKLLNSKKTRVTLRKVKPGTYSCRYRATAVRNNQVVAKTRYSPKISFTAS